MNRYRVIVFAGFVLPAGTICQLPDDLARRCGARVESTGRGRKTVHRVLAPVTVKCGVEFGLEADSVPKGSLALVAPAEPRPVDPPPPAEGEPAPLV